MIILSILIIDILVSPQNIESISLEDRLYHVEVCVYD